MQDAVDLAQDYWRLRLGPWYTRAIMKKMNHAGAAFEEQHNYAVAFLRCLQMRLSCPEQNLSQESFHAITAAANNTFKEPGDYTFKSKYLISAQFNNYLYCSNQNLWLVPESKSLASDCLILGSAFTVYDGHSYPQLCRPHRPKEETLTQDIAKP